MKLENYFVNLVHKDLLPPVQDLLHACQHMVTQVVLKVNIPPKQVQYTQNNVFRVHQVHIQLQPTKFILAPVVAVLVNTVVKQD